MHLGMIASLHGLRERKEDKREGGEMSETKSQEMSTMWPKIH